MLGSYLLPGVYPEMGEVHSCFQSPWVPLEMLYLQPKSQKRGTDQEASPQGPTQDQVSILILLLLPLVE